jgi:NAD(P)-dependent dehydrogenase (short-subunit alcohol dehydrogenase family)
VILACRNEEKAVEAAREIISETKSHQVLIRKLDMSSYQSIRKFAEEFNKEEERLDILINNAGIIAPRHELTEDGFESTIQVNYLSQFLLTLLLLKKLKNSSPSRIINVSSLSHLNVTPDTKSDEYSWAKCSEKDFEIRRQYQWSKLQQVIFTKELSKRLIGRLITFPTHVLDVLYINLICLV